MTRGRASRPKCWPGCSSRSARWARRAAPAWAWPIAAASCGRSAERSSANPCWANTRSSPCVSRRSDLLESAAAIISRSWQRARAAFAGKRLLIVEDDAAQRKTTRSKLAPLGAQIDEAADGQPRPGGAGRAALRPGPARPEHARARRLCGCGRSPAGPGARQPRTCASSPTAASRRTWPASRRKRPGWTASSASLARNCRWWRRCTRRSSVPGPAAAGATGGAARAARRRQPLQPQGGGRLPEARRRHGHRGGPRPGGAGAIAGARTFGTPS